jgi:hypothetical protein
MSATYSDLIFIEKIVKTLSSDNLTTTSSWMWYGFRVGSQLLTRFRIYFFVFMHSPYILKFDKDVYYTYIKKLI